MERPHRHKIVVIALGILVARCTCASALNPALEINQYAHTAWTIRDGVFQGIIGSIAQTPDGYLWLGTEFGLVRFDGVRFSPWQPPPGQQLPSENIRSLMTTRDGRLWIGTLNGLASWKDGKLTQYAEFHRQDIFPLLEDRDGTVWAAAHASLQGKLCAIRNGAVQCYGDDGSLGSGVFSIFEDRTGNLWVGGATGLWRWKPGPPTYYRTGDGVGNILELAEGDKRTLVLATATGLKSFVDGSAERYGLPGAPDGFVPTRMLQDRDGGFWIGTTEQGVLHVSHGRTDRFARRDGLSPDIVEQVFEDREGNIWVATHDGLDRFRDFAVPTMSVKQGLSSASPWSVLASRDGSLWLGTRNGLNRLKDGHAIVYRKENGLPDDQALSLFEDDRGRIWISTGRGIVYFESGRFIPVSGVPGGEVRFIVSDRSGTIWIAYQEQGLFRLRGLTVEQFSWNSLHRTDWAIAASPDPVRGGLWLGFREGGVAYLEDGQVRESYGVADGLGEGRVEFLRSDRDGALWAGTGGGLSRISKGQIATLTTRNGMPCDTIHWFMEDDAQAWWLEMACGLVRIDRTEIEAWLGSPKRTIKATVLDGSDGVRTKAISTTYTPRVAKSADGKLWFLPGDGVSFVDPRHIPVNRLPPPVDIQQIVADHRTYDTSSLVRLPPLVRDLQIDYTALSLVAPEKNRFRIRLEGWDQDWQDVGNRRQAFYDNLPPRSYRFRVIASNSSGVWNETGAVLDFSIAPAYYQTAWFRTLAVVAFLSLLWSAYRIRLRVIERHQAEITALNESLMKAQEQERTRIAGELHDGVMQQISALCLVLGTGKRQPEAEAKKTMADVQRKLIEVGTEVRQLSHNLHPPTLQDAGLPEALRGYCEEFSRVRNTPVSCHADDSVQDLSRGAALALYRIAQEAMGNAVTHGAAQHVDVRLARSNGLVALTVTDDGKGFDANRIGGLRGLGLINMRERAHQLNGTFELNSEPGRGTTVRVTIPFRRAV